MYFRLMAAMFGLTSRSDVREYPAMSHYVAVSSKILVPVRTLVIPRSNFDIPFTSCMVSAILKLCDTQDIRKDVLVIPYRLVKTA